MNIIKLFNMNFPRIYILCIYFKVLIGCDLILHDTCNFTLIESQFLHLEVIY